MDSASRATTTKPFVRTVLGAVACAALAAALFAGSATAQTPAPTSTKSLEALTEPDTGNAKQATPATTAAKVAAPAKKSSQPFTPTEKIDAESVVPFPADI